MDEPIFNDPMPTLLANAQVFLDGFGWTPLSTSHDYSMARDRALAEIFPEESRAAGLTTPTVKNSGQKTDASS